MALSSRWELSDQASVSYSSHKLPLKKKKKILMIGLSLPYECYMFPEIPSPKYGHKGMGEMFCE